RELACGHSVPEVGAHVAHFGPQLVHRARAVCDTDIGNAFVGVEVAIEFDVTAAETADVDDAPQYRGRFHVLVHRRSRNHVDDDFGTLAVGCLQHVLGPVRFARIDDEVGAELLEPRATRVIGRGADDELCAPELGDLQAQQTDPGA